MSYQERSAAPGTAIPVREREASSPVPVNVPRRRLLRALSGVAVGFVMLGGLAACGGEDEEGGEEEDDDD